MKWLILSVILLPLCSIAQDDSTELEVLGRSTILSEVVVRSDLNPVALLRRMKEDTTFYKAFRNLRVLEFTSINDIRMLDKKGRIEATLYSKTRQHRNNGCRTMEVLEEKTTGDMYKKGKLNYTTAELYASLFFTNGKVCGENNIVKGMHRSVRNKSGIDKHREQLKMMFFDPGKKIPGIPLIGDKIDIFSPGISKYYTFSIDMEQMSGQDCFVFRILPRENLRPSERNNIVFGNITTWFNEKTMEIVARHYDLSYDTPLYDFDVQMEVQMTRYKNYLVPEVLRYKGTWKVAFQPRERTIFTATLSDFSN